MPSRWRPDQAYNDLPRLPPQADIETKAILKQCITARAALAQLNQAAELIPNTGILINTLPLLEARASSEIENIVTSADKLFRHLRAEDTADPATREALRYRHALLEGFAALESRPLGTRTAETVCTKIKGIDMNVRRVPGTALVNQVTSEVIYTPPETESRLRELLANWERFLHGADRLPADPLDPLIRMAVAHYQFEAIHPFTDGNGRTGRVLNSLFLVEQELLPMPILYLSRYIIAHKSDYYRLILGVTRSNDQSGWEPWLLFMLRGVEETATWTTAKIAAIRMLAKETAELVRDTLPKIYSRELVDVVFEQPYCRISNVVEAGIAGRQAASRYLKALVSIGVLREQAFGREKLFVHSKLLDLLTHDENAFDSRHL
ncbi:MAG: Fic family protein [Deltaproteobacteria bacterium]|nr:Fic family protein [Deltaproteobacteria bacterium]MBW2577512.1 Fic family protein [Deltaproteobacteria bacterium]MBW2692766.1 Fic family protein [Deltaproteobacteria bacterium]